MPHSQTASGHLTRHANHRIQKRCIPPAVVDFALQFGENEPAGAGTERYFFTKKSWRKLQSYLGGGAAAFEGYRNVYVVACDGMVITTAYRRGRA